MKKRPLHIQARIDAANIAKGKKKTDSSKTNEPDSKKDNSDIKTSDSEKKNPAEISAAANESSKETSVVIKQERFIILFKKNEKSKWRLFPRLFHDSEGAEKALEIAERFINLKVIEVDLPE